jgi:hypothetical protein
MEQPSRTTYPNAEFVVRDLEIGDVIKQFEGPFGTAIVCQKTETEVTFFRPYGATAGFVYTGGVITYHGQEKTTFLIDSPQKFHVYQRGGLR